ncbi:hypothetical protein T484DRAFT_1915274 [Baffinella frigidus]|nr:hypothetical protein T484DRAFT_1915274 [Cryptophyta sp. CCMP2293]
MAPRSAPSGRVLGAMAILAVLLLAQVANIAGAGSAGFAQVDADDDDDEEDSVQEVHHHTFTPREQPKGRGTARQALQEPTPDDGDWDPDEFEGFEAPPPPPKSGGAAHGVLGGSGSGSGAQDPKKAAPRAPLPPREFKDLIPEVVMVAVLILYFINFVIGRSQNTKIAEQWLEAVKATLEDNFALVGAKNNCKWTRDGPACFTMYCSGRLNCESLTITMDLKPRQEAISRLWDVYSPLAPDQVKFEVVLGDGPETGGTMESFVFAVMPKNDETDVRERNTDLSEVTKKWKTALSDSLVAIADDEDITDSLVAIADDEDIPHEFLPKVVVDMLNEHAPYVKLIHFSGASLPHRMKMGALGARRDAEGLKFIFNLLPRDAKSGGGPKPIEAQLQAWDMLAVVALRYVDKVTNYRMSAQAKDRMKRGQAQLAEIQFRKGAKDREQQAQKRKMEKKLKDKESLSAAGQAKWEDKEEQLKKRKTTKIRTK